MLITICGPNLPHPLHLKGDMHAHSAGCADLRRYPNEHSGSTRKGWDIDVASKREAIEEVYEDMIFSNEESPWTDYESELTFFPCCQLPREVEV